VRAAGTSSNPAVDTVAAGGSVTWTWTGTGNVPHRIESLGRPSFPTGTVLTGDGNVVHGAMMPGTIVVR
jgi:hypothetical protein